MHTGTSRRLTATYLVPSARLWRAVPALIPTLFTIETDVAVEASRRSQGGLLEQRISGMFCYLTHL